ncbi:YolD-like family protein [Halobacillus sp. B29]|uniref:YolD-like family protein n=1 Tax=Halobacillus sp. B29 TaxID=3457432 RepID=UPI003FCE24D4
MLTEHVEMIKNLWKEGDRVKIAMLDEQQLEYYCLILYVPQQPFKLLGKSIYCCRVVAQILQNTSKLITLKPNLVV